MSNPDSGEVGGLLKDLPEELVNQLLTEFIALRRRFMLRDWGPGELNGGRFAESTLRILEWAATASYTPLGKTLNRQSILTLVENQTSLPDGLRFHVRRAADMLLDVRNKRDVAHLGGNIDVSRMDSELVLRLCSWILAELIRVYGGADPESAQRLIDAISAEQVPWIEEVDGDLLVLAMHRPASERTLLALHHAHPDALPIADLQATVGYKNSTEFRTKVLAGLARDRRIHLKDGSAFITSIGIMQIEALMTELRSG